MSQNSKFIHKSHNVAVLLYHLVSSAKYRRVVISDLVDHVISETCGEIEKRYEVFFLEVGTENVMAKYVKEQGMEKQYKALKKDYQLKLF